MSRFSLNSLDPKQPTITMPDLKTFTWKDGQTNEKHRRLWYGFEGGLKLVIPTYVANELYGHGGFVYQTRAPIFSHRSLHGVDVAAKVVPFFDHLKFDHSIGLAYELYSTSRATSPTSADLAMFQGRIQVWLESRITSTYQAAIEAQVKLRQEALTQRFVDICSVEARRLTALRQAEVARLQQAVDQAKLLAAVTELVIQRDKLTNEAEAWQISPDLIADAVQTELNKQYQQRTNVEETR